MARGGFIGALGSFAGGVGQGLEQAQKMRLQREQHEAAMEERDWTREQRQLAEDRRKALAGIGNVGDVVGVRNPEAALFTGSAEAAQEFMRASQGGTPARAMPANADIPANLEMFPEMMEARQAGLPAAQPAQAPAPRAEGMPTGQTPPPVAAPTPELTSFVDPMTGRTVVAQADQVRRMTQNDVYAREEAVLRQFGDVEGARALARDAAQMRAANRVENQARAQDILRDSLLSGGDPLSSLGSALQALNADDDITLGADFSVIATEGPDGKTLYTIGASPSGSGMPPKAVGAIGSYDNPATLYRAVESVISGKFGEFQDTVHNQQVQMTQLGLQSRAADRADRALAETERHNRVTERTAAASVSARGARNSDLKYTNRTYYDGNNNAIGSSRVTTIQGRDYAATPYGLVKADQANPVYMSAIALMANRAGTGIQVTESGDLGWIDERGRLRTMNAGEVSRINRTYDVNGNRLPLDQ